MKYNVRLTLILVSLFLVSQLVGLGVLFYDMEVVEGPSGELEVTHPDTAIGERPEVDVESGESVLYILGGVLIGTGLLLLIIMFAKVNYWKLLFFIAVLSTITITLGVFIDPVLAFFVAIVLALGKIFVRNPIMHNATEFLVYSGIAVLFVPLFNVFWMIILLLAISVYDAFAVWQSRHMIKLAKFQTGSRVFAGLLINTGKGIGKLPGKVSKAAKPPKAPRKVALKGEEMHARGGEAILGGGDIAFPLIFAGVVMESLIPAIGKELALLKTLIIPIILAIVLLLLLVKGTEGKFYPAMPFLTAGCLLGWALVLII